MGELIDMEGARALVADQTLWPRVRDFLWDFAPQVHPSWWPSEDARWPSADGRTEFDQPRLKAYLLSRLGVTPCFHAFPKDDWSRLLLLDGTTLESIAKWLGALACADSLRRVTEGKVVRELKAALAGVYPEVFGYTAYFRELAAKAARDAESIVVVGLDCLFDFVSRLDEPLRQRFRLKFPKNLCDLSGNEDRETVKPVAMARLLKLKFPEAYSLCCS